MIGFTKMHGAGNDFIVIDDRLDLLDIDAKAVTMLCDRHFGVGADGVIRIAPSGIGQYFMDYRNADGSVAEMCGNGVRVVAKWLGDRGFIEDEMLLETRGGSKRLGVHRTDGLVDSVTVNMGRAAIEGDITLDVGEPVTVTLVRTGNPHAVLVVDDVDEFPLERIGPKVEHSFSDGVNMPVLEVTDTGLRQRTWERGCGETFACGTGATGAFAVAHAKGLVGDSASVELRGGTLQMAFDPEGNVMMTGPAIEVCNGEFEAAAFGVRKL